MLQAAGSRAAELYGVQKTSESQNWKTWASGGCNFCEEVVVLSDGHVHHPCFPPRPAGSRGKEQRWFAC